MINKKNLYCDYLIVIEPQCIDEEHVSVNQSIISLFSESLKPNKIEFFADKLHYLRVIKNISNATEVNYNSRMPLGYKFRSSKITRGIYEFYLILISLKSIKKTYGENSIFLFTSITRLTIIFAKILALLYIINLKI